MKKSIKHIIPKNSILTIGSKIIILLINFSLVVFTSRVWGSEGRGEIALIMANIALIAIINNVFSGGTISYNTKNIKKNELLLISFLGTFLLSLFSSILFSLYYGFENFNKLFIISILMSLSQSISLFQLGKENVLWYNLINILSSALTIIIILFFYYILNLTTINTFFISIYISYGITLIVAIINSNFNQIVKIKTKNIKKIISYGFNNEISMLFQFLNYRLSYFFIAEWIGLDALGIFSVSLSIVEAIWIISKSMSINLFSRVINSSSDKRSLLMTKKLAYQNLLISIVLSFILILIPSIVFTTLFGENFIEVKKYSTYLIPGIIAISISNIYGHYFAGIGKLSVLKNKSYVGFIITLIFSIILIPRYQLLGVCITLNLSYIASSIYLFFSYKNISNLQQRKKNH